MMKTIMLVVLLFLVGGCGSIHKKVTLVVQEPVSQVCIAENWSTQYNDFHEGLIQLLNESGVETIVYGQDTVPPEVCRYHLEYTADWKGDKLIDSLLWAIVYVYDEHNKMVGQTEFVIKGHSVPGMGIGVMSTSIIEMLGRK